MPKAAKIEISEAIASILQKYSRSKTMPACQIQRATIILKASQGISNTAISEEIGLSRISVIKWRNRWKLLSPKLAELEEKNPEKLKREIEVFLKDIPRPGHPQKYTDEQVIKIRELACRPPSEYGCESSHWSLNQLKKVSIQEGIVEDISAKTVSRFLKYGRN